MQDLFGQLLISDTLDVAIIIDTWRIKNMLLVSYGLHMLDMSAGGSASDT
jgi:hypothetical protein